jgi:hypothetical protein
LRITLIARISPISVIPSWESRTLSRRFGTLISLLHRLSHDAQTSAHTLHPDIQRERPTPRQADTRSHAFTSRLLLHGQCLAT